MKETMTIHKALVELKILDARIKKEINEVKFVVANKHSNQKIDGVSIQDCIASSRDKYHSVLTLINRRNAIKQAVTRSNAMTKVDIAGTTYTVAEAIDMKSVGLSYWQLVLQNIESQYHAATRVATKENGSALDAKADSYMTTMYSGSDLKNMSDEIRKVREAFIASQTVDIVDCIGVEAEMKRLRDMLDAFASNVDAALSVSNALTTIEVEYETL